MANVQIKFLKDGHLIEFYSTAIIDQSTVVKRLVECGAYDTVGDIVVDFTGEDAAEEVWCLTNDPSREDECNKLINLDRNVCSGDIVSVDGVDYLCKSIGWAVLHTT